VLDPSSLSGISARTSPQHSRSGSGALGPLVTVFGALDALIPAFDGRI